MSGAIVLDGNSALSAEALSNQLGNSYNFATNMITQGFNLNQARFLGAVKALVEMVTPSWLSNIRYC